MNKLNRDMPAAAALNAILILLLFCCGTKALAEVAVSGSLTRYFYSKGVESSSVTGDFEFVSSADNWAFRLFEPDEFQDWRTFVVSDNQETFTSLIIDKKSAMPELKPNKLGFGSIESAPIPSRSEHRIASQILAFSYVISTKPVVSMETKSLRDDLIPEFVHRIARKEAADLRTEVVLGADKKIRQINFWALKKGSNVTNLENSDNCFLCVRADYRVHGTQFPEQFDVSIYTKYPDQNRSRFLSIPIARYTVTANLGSSGFESLLASIAYDPEYSVTVNDYRFSKKTGYMLRPKDSIPFRNSNPAGFAKVSADSQLRQVTQKSTARRGLVITIFLAAIPICLGIAVWKFSPWGVKQKNEK